MKPHISLKKYPEFLFTTFFRCNRSVIVNCRHVWSVSDSYINLDNGTKIKLSDKIESEFLSFIEHANIINSNYLLTKDFSV